MCTVSAVGDVYQRHWTTQFPAITQTIPTVSREEFDALKREVEECKRILTKAKKFDEETGQPDCEMEDKIALIKKVADLVGVDMSEVWDR